MMAAFQFLDKKTISYNTRRVLDHNSQVEGFLLPSNFHFYCSILRVTKFDSRFTPLYLKVSRDRETCSLKKKNIFVANIGTSPITHF